MIAIYAYFVFILAYFVSPYAEILMTTFPCVVDYIQSLSVFL